MGAQQGSLQQVPGMCKEPTPHSSGSSHGSREAPSPKLKPVSTREAFGRSSSETLGRPMSPSGRSSLKTSPSSSQKSRTSAASPPTEKVHSGKSQTSQKLTRNSVRRQTTNSSVGSRGLSAPPQGAEAGSKIHRHSRLLEANVAPEHRIICIGDLHGMPHKAKALWQVLQDTLGEHLLLSALVVFLGDYCDRGLYTKELLWWLISLQRDRASRGGRTICLLGNHEFCLLGFLGLLPKPDTDPDFSFRQTWDRDDGIVSRNERDRWWGANIEDDEDNDAANGVHLQGRRWGGTWYDSYGPTATFASYQVDRGDREGLRKKMPQEHLNFLQACPWVHIEENPMLGRIIFVHAGLEADGSEECEEQLARLVRRDARHPQPEPLFGRDGVLHTPPQLARHGTAVISGHHGRILLKPNRVILDSCCGDEKNPLTALILPETLLLQHDGHRDHRDPSSVFASRFRNTLSSPKAKSVRQPEAPSCRGETIAKNSMPQGDSTPLEWGGVLRSSKSI